MNKATLYSSLSPNILEKIGGWVSTKHSVQQQLLYSILRSTDKYQRDRNRWQQQQKQQQMTSNVWYVPLDDKKIYIFTLLFFLFDRISLVVPHVFLKKSSMNKYSQFYFAQESEKKSDKRRKK